MESLKVARTLNRVVSILEKNKENDLENKEEKLDKKSVDEHKIIEKILEKIQSLEKESPKITKAIDRLNRGMEINPKLKKVLDEMVETIYENDPMIQKINDTLPKVQDAFKRNVSELKLENIKKYGLSTDDLTSCEHREELLAHISHLESKINIAQENLEIIISGKPSARDCVELAEIALEGMSVRNWKKGE